MHEILNWHTCLFFLFALLACGFAVAVAAVGNIVHAACCLAASLAAVGGLFFLAGAEFLGAVQLLLYVGGTMVLLVFGVMLTARGPAGAMKISQHQMAAAIVICGVLLGLLLVILPGVSAWARHPPKTVAMETVKPSDLEQLGFALLGIRMDRVGDAEAAAQGDFAGYLIAFELLSLHLVVVLVGAAYLARARRRAIRLTQSTARGYF